MHYLLLSILVQFTRFQVKLWIKKICLCNWIDIFHVCVRCGASPVTFNMSLTPAVTANDPTSGNIPRMHSRILLDLDLNRSTMSLKTKKSTFLHGDLLKFLSQIFYSETNVYSLLFPDIFFVFKSFDFQTLYVGV